MSSSEFYQSHLDQVSRSFAFCIAQLDEPLKAWVAQTYLICRILDTVEDAPWQNPEIQLDQFRAFDSFIQNGVDMDEYKMWRERFPVEIPEGESALLDDGSRIFSDLQSLPPTTRQIISEMVLSMSAGMKHFVSSGKDGRITLKKLCDVNQYCFFVAGVVGETLAKLLSQVEPEFQPEKQRVLEAHHFGQFLQKVNLLKDQATDQKEGRELVHDRKAVFFSIGKNLMGALKFLEALPRRQKRFRLFCAWSLFLGLASLPVSQKFFLRGGVGKIPRRQTEILLKQIEDHIDQPQWLHKQANRLAKMAGVRQDINHEAQDLESAQHQYTSVSHLYRGHLGPEEFFDLGLA